MSVVGTLVQGDSVLKTNSGITSGQQRKGAISATIDITFVADGTLPHIKASWGAGTVAYSDGTTEAVAASNTGSLSVSTTYFVYKIEGNTALQFSTTFTDAMGDDRVYLGQFLTQAAADPTADSAPMIRLIFGSSDAVLNVGHLSAIVANLGTVTAGSLDAVSITGSTITGGTIRTVASPAARLEMTGTSLKGYDSSNVEKMELFLSSGSVGTIKAHKFIRHSGVLGALIVNGDGQAVSIHTRTVIDSGYTSVGLSDGTSGAISFATGGWVRMDIQNSTNVVRVINADFQIHSGSEFDCDGDIDLAGDLNGASDSVLIGRHKIRKLIGSAWSAGDIGADEIVFEWTDPSLGGRGAYLLIKENVTVWEVALTAR